MLQCTWMKNRLCNQLHCSPGSVCATTNRDCSNLNNYGVGCEGKIFLIYFSTRTSEEFIDSEASIRKK